jgi:hypothetical protein
MLSDGRLVFSVQLIRMVTGCFRRILCVLTAYACRLSTKAQYSICDMRSHCGQSLLRTKMYEYRMYDTYNSECGWKGEVTPDKTGYLPSWIARPGLKDRDQEMTTVPWHPPQVF